MYKACEKTSQFYEKNYPEYIYKILHVLIFSIEVYSLQVLSQTVYVYLAQTIASFLQKNLSDFLYFTKDFIKSIKSHEINNFFGPKMSDMQTNQKLKTATSVLLMKICTQELNCENINHGHLK